MSVIHVILKEMNTKKCIRCGDIKLETEFFSVRNTLRSHCKKCHTTQSNLAKERDKKKNPEKYSEMSKKYYLVNRDKILSKRKEWLKNNRDKVNKARLIYMRKKGVLPKEKLSIEEVSLRYKICQKKYRDSHKKERNEYLNNKYKENINHRLSVNLRNRIRLTLKSGKSGSTVKDLGCSISDLKFYLEGKFQDGMTWEKWGVFGWHIDHVIPLAFFDLSNREQFLKACHYTNLQPLWAKDNLQKSYKLLDISKSKGIMECEKC